MASYPTDKTSESDSDSSNINNAKNKEAETRDKNNETETCTDQDAQVKDFQSAGAQFENSSGDSSGNTGVDRVKKKGDDGQSGDTEHVHKEKDDVMPTQQTCSSGFQQNEQDQIVRHTGKTTNVSHAGKQEDAKHNSKSGKRQEDMPKPISSGSHTEKLSYSKPNTLKTADEGKDRKPEIKEKDSQSVGAQFDNSSRDDAQSRDSINVDTEADGVGSSADSGEKNVTCPKEETTKLILTASQMETKTEKQVNKKSLSKSGVSSSGDSGQVKVDDDMPKPISSGSHTEKLSYSKPNTLKTADEGKDRKPEIKEKDSQSVGAQFDNSSRDDAQSRDSINVDTEADGVGSSADSGEKNVTCPKEETTKLILTASQTETKTEKQVNKKSLSKSGVSSSGDSRQVNVHDDMPKPISSGSHTEKQPYSKYETLKTTDEGSDRKPEMKEEELPQHSPYSGLPQQRPPQIREGTDNNLPWIGIFVVLVSVVCGYYLHFSGSTPNKIPKQLDMVEVFNQEMEKLQASFPSQRQELWKRSLIHIRRHLKTEHPTEPVSLILTSGHRAEKTLGCLAQCLAQAFSTTRNSTFLSIDGKAKTSLDSDQVKLDIDSELTKAFESEKFAAVIHRFEELPPGSTLIFYRYCDHENAAFKNVFLAFTVMLDAEAEVPSNINLGRIEEMVQDHVKQKFVSSDKSAVFNQMDVDKLSGLWSRISHLILPVVAEKRIEQQGCGACDKPF
ncbi:uncharacterized protein isoform X3 [Danio rerio]|uniref:Uncharacterized protein isoform X2 n=1 Tax=Danio rerio TaxID=7955 RepID=A0A8M3B4U5_DANRE|nr:lamina-associated polypeptide 1B isoform X3 [Danio rerio]|eukprot:XP_009302171.1 lamina-associated polypeptide 1B isoform X3 [Danio rerio]